MNAEQIVDQLQRRFTDPPVETREFRGDWAVSVPAEIAAEVLAWMRAEDGGGFEMLVDLCGVDHFGGIPRFEVIYVLHSFAHGLRLRVRVPVDEDEEIASVTDLWPTANWHEREVWDLFGIRFAGHPNLERILMWEGYPHHPLRKDFPTQGIGNPIAHIERDPEVIAP